MSPQIVTETLYSLVITQAQPFIPTEIHLITTLAGAKEARLQLLHPKTGQFKLLCQDYQLSGIHFQEENIHIIEDYQGNKLDDIKTPEQNKSAADFITDIVSRLTRDENAALHVSIAGGRKTMGYYLGYALSLYGRSQDRLSHVLVTDNYESLKDFFYPTPESRVIEDKEGRSLDSHDAEVMLAEIPFVRMRGGIPQHLLDGKTGFNESIKFARQIEFEPVLQINKSQRFVQVGDIKIGLTDVNYTFYLWVLGRILNGEPVRRMIDDNTVYAEEFMAVYRDHVKGLKDDDRTRETLRLGMSSQWLSERISAVRKSFELALGPQAAKPFLVQSSGGNNNRIYSIALTEEQICYL
jgi:CRISPR-associated protein (TIGR02584 family)